MKAPSRARELFWPAWVAPIAGCLVTLGGLATFLGWRLNFEGLKDWFGTGVTMKANPSVAAFLAGISILLLSRGLEYKLAVRILASVIFLIGSLTLSQHVFGWNLGIDTLIFREAPGAIYTTSPGRMGPPASTMYSLTAVGLVLSTLPGRARRSAWILGLIVCALGLLSVTGYMFGSQNLYGIAKLTAISAQMALLGTLMGIGLIGAVRDRGPMKLLLEDSGAGMLVRQALPIVFIAALTLGWMRTQAQNLGFVDAGTGRALLVLSLVALICVVLWRGALMVSARERELKDKETLLEQSLAARKAAQEALEISNEQLEKRVSERTAELTEANEQLNGFTHSIAHDLRQSIRGIVVNAQLVLREHSQELDEDGRAALERLERAGKKMALLVDDLLNYARVGKLEPIREPVDLTALARSVAEDCGSAYPGASVVVDEALSASADPALLKLVMENLIDNACKYVAPGEEARVHVGRSNGAFFVRDQGIGFDSQYATRVFEPFERLVAGQYEGSGIGLANVKRVIAKHGGSIWCESSPGVGTTFYFTLEPR